MVTQQTISVGDSVQFTLGTSPVCGVVIDDRGAIGANGVRIFRVRIPNDPYDDDIFEMPEDELVRANESVELIPKAKIVDYLENDGLVQILKKNMPGEKTQPRVWLRRDSLGNVIHTFKEERGSIGGATVPSFALHENRVFEPKLREVLTFLKTFSLSEHDAKKVVKAVGIAP